MAQQWLQQALTLAHTAKSRHRHAALVVRDGVIIGRGVAKRIGTDPGLSDRAWRCSYLHAEMAALTAAGSAARGATLYVARVTAVGTPTLSAPCVRCQRYARRCGVSKIVWTE